MPDGQDNQGAHHEHIDPFLPAEMAERAAAIGVQKANKSFGELFVLAILAGAFIALGAVFATVTVTAGDNRLPFGIARLMAGVTFSLGLILVVVAGAELFTGNNLKVMALASGKLRAGQLARSWAIVYAGNLVGAVATAVIMLWTRQFMLADGAVGKQVLEIASAKCQLSLGQATALGMLCNALVCLAVWLCYSARSVTDKILAIVFPITAFVASGFEHSVANMYFIPIGMLVKANAPGRFWQDIGATPADYDAITWQNFLLTNLAPVTVGNIIGGSVMVGLVYWFVYLRGKA